MAQKPGRMVRKMGQEVDGKPVFTHADRCKASIPDMFRSRNIPKSCLSPHPSIRENAHEYVKPWGSLPVLHHSLHIDRLLHDHLALITRDNRQVLLGANILYDNEKDNKWPSSKKKKKGITWLMSPSKARRVAAASTAITSPGSIVTSSSKQDLVYIAN